jgi:hypothetical protein
MGHGLIKQKENCDRDEVTSVVWGHLSEPFPFFKSQITMY